MEVCQQLKTDKGQQHSLHHLVDFIICLRNYHCQDFKREIVHILFPVTKFLVTQPQFVIQVGLRCLVQILLARIHVLQTHA